MKKVSVITPVLNSGHFLQRALDSVRNQNYPAIEHIVVDGGSNDNTLQILSDSTSVKWISEKDNGQSDAMNKGFDMASGDIVVYLNADDYFLPGVFSSIISHFNSGAQIVFGRLKVIYPDGSEKIHIPSLQYPEILSHWLGVFPVNPIQYFYERKLQENIKFNVNNHFAMDHEFLLHLCKDNRIVLSDTVFGVYDMHADTKTMQQMNKSSNYWLDDNFSYIDKHLESFSKKFIIDFKNQQHRFYREKTINFFQKQSLYRITDLLNLVNNSRKLIIYGAGTYTEAILPLLYDGVQYIIDRRAEKTPEIQGIKVLPPNYLQYEECPDILVTATRHRADIVKIINEYCNNANVMFLDEILRWSSD